MIIEEISTLVGQCEDFHSAYSASIMENEDDYSSLSNFLVNFFTGAAQYKLVSKASLDSVVREFNSREVLETFVFSLRFAALSPFDSNGLKKIVDAFATANAHSPQEPDLNSLCALPNDATEWRVKKEDLVKLYNANLWVIPLFAFAFLFKEKLTNGEGL